jgi:hypothetical protein
MQTQTPPEVTDGQYGKLEDVARDLVRKYRINGTEFQYLLGHSSFASRFGEILNDLANEHRLTQPLIERPSFATIEVGTYKTTDDIRQALAAGNFRIGDWASDLMNRPEFTLLTEPAKLDLYMASNAELGYPNGCTVAQSFEALEKIGAVKLPPEAGAQYRLKYADQPLNEWRLMYMDPITGSDGGLGVFSVERDGGGLWLDGRYAGPGRFYGGDYVWVFARK